MMILSGGMGYANNLIVEERNLVKFFGAQYEEYRKRTGTMIPFVP